MDPERRAQLDKIKQYFPELATGAEVPAGPLGRIQLHFALTFANWGLILPPDDVAARRRGKICDQGWAIWYLFDRDERGEYLDYYSAHRMTGDVHERVYEDGSLEYLDTMLEFGRCSDDPVEHARLKAEELAEQRRVAQLLEEKGFGLDGDEPGAVQINRVLRVMDREE